MDKVKYLVKNIFIYGIGNLATKLISIFLFPLYTYWVKPEDLGYYDISLTIIFLIIPFYTFNLREGVFRITLNDVNGKEKQMVYKSIFRQILRNTFFLILFAVGLSFLFDIPYIFYILLLIIVNGLFELISFILRVESKKYFVLTNFVSVSIILLLSYIFLFYMDMGIEGIYLSNILGRFMALVTAEFKFKFIFGSLFNKSVVVTKELNLSLIKYSMPLIPLVISGFLIDISNKLFIEHYLGLEQNGIYAVASRFMTIILFLALIFHQAWQETAIKEYESPQRNEFFTQVFNVYVLTLSVLVGSVSIGLKIFYPILIADIYQDSLQYVFLLFIGVVFLALVSFLDLGYQCSKQTNKSIMSVMYCVIINIGLNYILINLLGLYGIVISYCISYLFLFIYRFYSTRCFFTIKWNKLGYFSILLFLLFGSVFYLINNVYILYLVLFVTGGGFVFFFIKKQKILIS